MPTPIPHLASVSRTIARSVITCALTMMACAETGCHVISLPSAATTITNSLKHFPRRLHRQADNADHQIHDEQPRPDHEIVQASHESQTISPPDNSPIALSLMSAVQLALTNNGRFHVKALEVDEVRTGVDSQLAAFDPVFGSGGQFAQVNQQTTSTVAGLGSDVTGYEGVTFAAPGDLSDQMQISKRWSSGTRTRLGYSTNFSRSDGNTNYLVLNPSWQSGLNLTVEQPIGSGFGRRQNEIGIEIAQRQVTMTQHAFRAEVNRLLFEISTAYWQYYLADAQLGHLKLIAEQARIIFSREQKSLRMGSSSAAEEAQARENWQSIQAQVAAAEQAQKQTERALRAQLGLRADDPRPLVPQDVPSQQRVSPDILAGVAAALQSREEIRGQRTAVQQARLQLDRDRAGLLPGINASASYSLSGLSSDLFDSYGELTSSGFGNWGLGLSYTRSLGLRAEQARVERSEVALHRQKLALIELEKQLEFDVHQAGDDINGTFTVMEHQQARLEAARDRYRNHQRMYETGLLDLDTYVRSQRDFLLATRDTQQAIVNYNLAISRWQYTISQPELATLSTEAAGRIASDQARRY